MNNNSNNMFHCDECGEVLTKLGYNYDTGHVEYECPECGKFFIDLTEDDNDED